MTYTIQSGDTLGKIATKFLGDATRFKEIMAVNPQITNPNLIKVGQIITLPAAATASPSIPASPTAPISSSNLPAVVSAAPVIQSSSYMDKVKSILGNQKLMLAVGLGLIGVLVIIKKKQQKLAKA